MDKTLFTLNLPLPRNYRLSDLLEFHRRDLLEISEKVTGNAIEKAIVWQSHPALLRFSFTQGHVEVSLNIDGEINHDQSETLLLKSSHMLGLNQNTFAFESTYFGHDKLGKLLSLQNGLRIPQASSMFEALTWAIIGQQISLNAAVSIRRRLIIHLNIRHSSGLLCYPDADHITKLTLEDLRSVGLSLTKATTLQSVCKMVINGDLPLENWNASSDMKFIRSRLIQIKGIGPWTINYLLLRGIGYLDGSLHGDAAVRNKLTLLLGLPKVISEKDTELWLENFAPWRSLVAAHLWAMTK